MNISFIVNNTLKSGFFLLLLCASLGPSSFAYNGFSHGKITRLALIHLKSHAHFPETPKWYSENVELYYSLQETLVRGNIDSDYRADLFFNIPFHGPTTGGWYEDIMYTYTSLQHFLDISHEGKYWEKDGYSYANSSRQGKDDIFIASELGITVNGNLSTSLGGKTTNFPSTWTL